MIRTAIGGVRNQLWAPLYMCVLYFNIPIQACILLCPTPNAQALFAMIEGKVFSKADMELLRVQ